jgi:hypothetical protein
LVALYKKLDGFLRPAWLTEPTPECLNKILLLHSLQLRDGFEDDIRDEDIPSDEMIERMDERLEGAQSEQKNLFLIIFQVRGMIYPFQD